ncbi:PKD domain-containing protein [Chryseolinea soli]|uniref:PKD domain-containing protein n=1 Tax=Chryseolinea soli TaxID=2321403 RepID=A0A385SZ11_9BACT|nr:PKD domain-containing protein [Chryseolinea soli]AYB35325.1 PKD domain-containing protein [Chryseolinea soli]
MKKRFVLVCIVMLSLCFYGKSIGDPMYNANFQYSRDAYQQLMMKFDDLSGPAFPTGWHWTFGDGTSASTSQNPTHLYAQVGPYTVTLTVNWGTTQRTIEKEIWVGYVADFSWTQPTYVGSPIYFKDITVYECFGTPRTYSWTSGKASGEQSSSSAPSFIYDTPGTYSVQLCTIDACGHSLCATKQVTVTMPENNLKPEFVSNRWQISKNETVIFRDTSTPPEDIKWWAWAYEQPSSLMDEGIVQNNDIYYYYSYKENVSHKFDRTGLFKVRLRIGTTTTTVAGEIGPGNESVYVDHLIEVKDMPEPEPIYTDNSSSSGMIDYDLTDNTFAGIRTLGFVCLYRKLNPNDPASWAPTGRWVAERDFVGQYVGLSQVKADNDVALVQSLPDAFHSKYGYHVFEIDNSPTTSTGTGTQIDWWSKNPSKLLSLSDDKPHFDIKGNEIVVVQREGAVLYLYYLYKTTASWEGNISVTKTAIQTNATENSQKIFIDDNAIVTKVGSQIFIFEKVNGVWNFSSKKVINIESIDPAADDFAYAGNTVVVTARSPDCPDFKTSSVLAKVYQKPGSGWPAVTTTYSAALGLLKDSDVSPNTWICLPPDNVAISENYIAIKVVLTNANSVTRRYIYKKLNGAWTSMDATYKINLVDEILPTVTSNYETACGFRALDRVDFYNYDSFCTLYPYPVTNQTITGLHDSVDKGLIDVGSVTFNLGAAVRYRGIRITLKPDVKVKSGSRISFSGVPSCDALYFISK